MNVTISFSSFPTCTFEVLLLALPLIMEKSAHSFKMESQKAAKCFQVFCNVSLCQWLSGSVHFKRLQCLNLHGSRRHNDPSKHREPPTPPPLITPFHYKRLESSATPQPNLISWTAFKVKQIMLTLRNNGTDIIIGKWWRYSLVTRPDHQTFHTAWHQSSVDWFT